MPADLLESYRHSGKFNPAGVIAAPAAAVLGVPLGLAYAYLLHWIPFIYINFFLTLGYGFAFGWVTTRVLKATQVRNVPVAAGCRSLNGPDRALLRVERAHPRAV